MDLALEIQAERYTHSNESMAALNRRMAGERPESPYQTMKRRKREQQLVERLQVATAALANIEARRSA